MVGSVLFGTCKFLTRGGSVLFSGLITNPWWGPSSLGTDEFLARGGVRPLFKTCKFLTHGGVRPLFGTCKLLTHGGVRPLLGLMNF